RSGTRVRGSGVRRLDLVVRPSAVRALIVAVGDRQLEYERGALTRQRLRVQPTGVGLGEATRDRQAESRAAPAPQPAAAVEGLEHPLQLTGCDPRTSVDNAHDQPPPAGPLARAMQSAAREGELLLARGTERLHGARADRHRVSA